MVSESRVVGWKQRLAEMTGDFTAAEFAEAVAEIQRLRDVLAWIAESGPDDAYELRDAAYRALNDGAQRP